MEIDWQAILSEGFGDHMQTITDMLGQQLFLLRQANGPILWPPEERVETESWQWIRPLLMEDKVVAYVAGAECLSAAWEWVQLSLRERIYGIQLHRQLNLSQVRLIEEIKAHAELEEALKFMELKALQSQVNPHFLFNTLTTIAGLAVFEGAEQTNRLVQALSRLLRYSLRKIGQTVTLQEEMEHVRDYLAIQKARFGDRIKVNIDIAEDTSQAHIPVLTLQPLVENAIIHGLESQEDGCLSLLGCVEDERVVIQIVDNGVGIEPERLSEIQELRANMSGRSHTTGLGFSNVHKRLQHFFGSSYGLRLESAPDNGTKVIVTIPLIR